MPTRDSKKTIIAEYPADEIFDLLKKSIQKRKFTINGVKYTINMNSNRYYTFNHNPECVCCGILGTKMLLEKYKDVETPHFNFYAVAKDYSLVLMTKDHIRPKSMGGQDRHSNFQTMCTLCNGIKGSSLMTLDCLKQLRVFYDAQVEIGMDRKLLTIALDELKLKLEQQSSFSLYEIPEDPKEIRLNCDIAVLKVGDKLLAHHIHNNKDCFCCIPYGTKINPICKLNKNFVVYVNEEFVYVPAGYTTFSNKNPDFLR